MRELSRAANRPNHRDLEVSYVMRSVSSVIVSATKSTPHDNARRKSSLSDQVLEHARPRSADAAATKEGGRRTSLISDASIRQIQMRWRLRKAKRLLEKISAEKILGTMRSLLF